MHCPFNLNINCTVFEANVIEKITRLQILDPVMDYVNGRLLLFYSKKVICDQ